MNTTFSTIAVFQYSSEALILKGRLESEGIYVFIKDQHTIDTDPLVSNAIGGVKLQVRSEDEERALQIIESTRDHTLNDLGEPIHCPKCGSDKVYLDTTIDSVKTLVLYLLFWLPINQKPKYYCLNCNHKFRTDV